MPPEQPDKEDIRRASGRRSRLILLTRMLTTDMDELGCGWNGLSTPSGAARQAGRWWTTPDILDLATDQKAGGSSPSERANVFPAQRVEPSGSISPPVPSSRILAASAIPAASFRRSA